MATEQQIAEGIRRADRAGDADAVKALGAELLRIRQAAKPKPKPGVFDIIKNDVVGLAKGVAQLPDAIADAGEATQYYIGRGLGRTVEGGLRAVGADRAANSVRGFTDRGTNAILASPNLNEMMERDNPTPEWDKGARFASEIVGSVVSPFNKLANAPTLTRTQKTVQQARVPARRVAPPSKSEPIINVASRLGVRPTPATTGGGVAGAFQTGLGSLPGAGSSVGKAMNREVDDLGAAAGRVARELGPVSTPQAAGEALAQGGAQYSRETAKAGGALYQARDALIGGKDAPVILGSAAKEAQDFAQQFPNISATLFEHPAIQKLVKAMPDGPEPTLTLGEATDALSHIRGALRNAERSNTITGPMKARITAFEQAIEGDVMRAAQASDAIAGRTGVATAQAAQRNADRFWAIKRATERGPLKKALASYGDDVTVSGESVFKAMVGDMNRQGGNIKRFGRTWKAMPQNARDTFAATAFDELGRGKPGASSAIPESIRGAIGLTDDVAEGGWSFNTFHTNYSAMSPEARKLAFGGKGVDQQIDDIARYASRLKELDRSRNFSNTARATMAGAYVSLVGGQMLSGDFEGAGKSALAIPMLALAGKGFMSSAPGRLWVRNSLRSLVQQGGTQAGETTLRRLTNQLPVIAVNNPAIRAEATAMFRALNDKTGEALSQSPQRAMATGQDEKDRGRIPVE